MEADFAFRLGLGGGVGGDELFDGVEDDEEVLVVLGVFGFEGVDFLGQQGVGLNRRQLLCHRFWRTANFGGTSELRILQFM